MLEPFQLLFDDDIRSEFSLPEDIRRVYGGDWHLKIFADRPYSFSNFALSRDGRVSFNESGHMGGGDVSGFNQHDQWLMALLRARADAVVMGDGTLLVEPEHLWTSDFIFPEESHLFNSLRKSEQRKPRPLQVFLSFDGLIDKKAAVFAEADFQIIIATTERGYQHASKIQCAAQLTVLNLGEQDVDLVRLGQILKTDFSVNHMLCEGGPRAYGSYIAAGLMDDEFLALCPTVIGNDTTSGRKPRPGLIEGAAFKPKGYPKSVPVSLRRAADHLFLRSSYVYE